jgi:Zn-dependent membrane protease YugP
MGTHRRVHPVADRKEMTMPSWLLILIVGIVLLIFGIAVEAAQFLIWLGIIVLVVSLILGLVGRGRRSTI